MGDGDKRNSRRYCVDPDVQLAINEGNDEVKRAITVAFKEALRDAVDNIKSHIDLVTGPLKDDVKRLRSDVSDLYEKDRDMRDRVGKVEARLAMGDGKEVGEDKAGAEHARKYELTIGKVGLIVALASLAGGAIGWLIKTF